MTKEHTLEHLNDAWAYVIGSDGLIHTLYHGMLYLGYAWAVIAVIFAIAFVAVAISKF